MEFQHGSLHCRDTTIYVWATILYGGFCNRIDQLVLTTNLYIAAACPLRDFSVTWLKMGLTYNVMFLLSLLITSYDWLELGKLKLEFLYFVCLLIVLFNVYMIIFFLNAIFETWIDTRIFSDFITLRTGLMNGSTGTKKKDILVFWFYWLQFCRWFS